MVATERSAAMAQSPFPGMDPYLESPELWPDVHNQSDDHFSSSSLAICLRLSMWPS